MKLRSYLLNEIGNNTIFQNNAVKTLFPEIPQEYLANIKTVNDPKFLNSVDKTEGLNLLDFIDLVTIVLYAVGNVNNEVPNFVCKSVVESFELLKIDSCDWSLFYDVWETKRGKKETYIMKNVFWVDNFYTEIMVRTYWDLNEAMVFFIFFQIDDKSHNAFIFANFIPLESNKFQSYNFKELNKGASN